MEQLTSLTRTTTCKHHGDFVSNGKEIHPARDGFRAVVKWTDCEACGKQREKEWEEAARKRAECEEAAARADLRRRLFQSGIPRLFREGRRLKDYAADNCGQKKALRMASEYAIRFEHALDTGRNLLFIGSPGCGKTHLACAIGLEVLDMGGTVRYTTVGDMNRRITDTWRNRDGESESEVLDDFSSCTLLIVDEAGVQSGSEVDIRNITSVIDGRYRDQLPTILVSNLMIDRLTPLVGDRVIDRLRDNGSQLIAFNWASYRGKREVHQ